MAKIHIKNISDANATGKMNHLIRTTDGRKKTGDL